MNIKRINRRECSINVCANIYSSKLTGGTTSCSREYVPGFGSIYDITNRYIQRRIRTISNPSIKMDKLGLN